MEWLLIGSSTLMTVLAYALGWHQRGNHELRKQLRARENL